MVGSFEINEAAKRGETIDERTGYWRSVVNAKDVRSIERKLSNAMGSIIHSWRAPVLKKLAEMGIAK